MSQPTPATGAPRLRYAGDSALLLEFEPIVDVAVNARAVATANAIQHAAIPGVRDVLATYRSVAVHFAPLTTDETQILAAVEGAAGQSAKAGADRTVLVPVDYGGESGPDIDDVAARAGLSAAEVAARHAAIEYRVFMLGFLPGFAYMGAVDPVIAAPRRSTPRVRVPAGSVGIADRQTGIYPLESPGGWQIVGRTPLRMFDAGRTPPALLAPGDRVRFVPRHASPLPGEPEPETGESASAAARREEAQPVSVGAYAGTMPTAITVLRPGLFTTVQDLGRWGHQSLGVPVSGAMDPVALRIANAAVGNTPGAAALEATLIGPELRMEQRTVMALAGADLGATLNGASIPLQAPVHCDPGSVLRFTGRRRGARTYIAFAGGIAVPEVLGSRSTHVRSGLGGLHGRALKSGDELALDRSDAAPRTIDVTSPLPAGGARLRVVLGPQDESFAPAAVQALLDATYSIDSQSDRMGYRLTGPVIARPSGEREMISDATFPGALQIPPSGAPILLMADRQTIGGYPQIATVISADLSLAGQLAPGDWVAFDACSRADALAALAEQQGAFPERA